jgi:glycosyltransferase involved in cell wall biosynthesis
MINQTQLAVTIDARALDGALMGTQVHVLELVRALARTGELSLRVLIYAEQIDRTTLELLRELPGAEILAVEEVDEQTDKSAVFHRPLQAFSPGDVSLGLSLGERVVLNQLDLIAYRNRGYFPDETSWESYMQAGRHAMAAAERVVVFSEHTRGDLLVNMLVEPERIRVIPPGLNHRFEGEPRRPSGLAADKTAADLEQLGFLLCIGADYEHKNRVFALELLAELKAHHGWHGTLVFAGAHVSHGSSRETERELLDAHPQLHASVIDLGPVDEAEKEWLMAHTTAVLYPSMYEGFGLVPFEAALHGVPCVFAAVSSLAEGRTAEASTIVPWDPVSSAAAAHALLSDPTARARHVELLAGGAHELTWERTARATIEVYREAIRAPVRVAATLSRDAVAREAQLTAAHEAVVQRLIDERELVLGDYDALLAEVGPARSLIGEHGSLPADLQRALLALSAHPRLSRPLYGFAANAFRAGRALVRAIRRPLRRA